MQPESSEHVMAGDVLVERNVPARMRDGATLYADVYRPEAEGPWPVLLQRIPYDKRIAQSIVYQHPSWYARHGYVVAIQDVRGRYTSEGEFDPLRTEAEDGYDTIQWAATLPDTTGKVGMYGFSYAGATQLLAATLKPPALTCLVPGFTGSDYYKGWTYKGGAFHLAFIISWIVQLLAIPDALKSGHPEVARQIAEHLNDFPGLYTRQPLNEFPLLTETGVAPYLFQWLEHDTWDAYWKDISLEHRYDSIEVPCLHVGGWYDTFIEGTLKNFTELSSRYPDRHQLVVGSWLHMPWGRVSGGVNFGEAADNRIDELQLQWFDHWLKGVDNGVGDKPSVETFTLGTNTWEEAASWPPPGVVDEAWYLHSGGRANSLSGNGALMPAPSVEGPPDVYVYNPGNPVPSLGGASCCDGTVTPMGAYEQTALELRNDVLIYSSQPLAEDVHVTGTIRLVLYAATSGVDTDWTGKLVDVGSDGQAYNLCDGIIRARFREGWDRTSLLEPYQCYRYDIVLGSVNAVFKRGHRIRLDVASSNFPAHDINPNTGARVGAATLLEADVVTQAVFHDPAQPSHLILPVRRVLPDR